MAGKWNQQSDGFQLIFAVVVACYRTYIDSEYYMILIRRHKSNMYAIKWQTTTR